MDLFLFHPNEYESLYNCSFYDVNQVPFEQRQHIGLGLMFLVLALALEILYIPCSIAIWRHMENGCFKIMFYIAIADMLAMLMNGIATGYLAIVGAVFCTQPTLTYVLGAYGMSLWGAETMAEVILAFNRCVEICSPRYAEKLFKGKRTWIWLLLPTFYGLYWFMFTEPHVFSGIYVSWFFNPHVGYVDDFGKIYRNNLHDYHNYFVIAVLSSTYFTFSILLAIKSYKFKNNSAQSHSQRMTFIQVVLISSINAIAAGIYVIMQFTRISQLLIIVGQLSWLFAHGIPPIIYLALNRTLRKDCHQMVIGAFGRLNTGNGTKLMVVNVNRTVHSQGIAGGRTAEHGQQEQNANGRSTSMMGCNRVTPWQSHPVSQHF